MMSEVSLDLRRARSMDTRIKGEVMFTHNYCDHCLSFFPKPTVFCPVCGRRLRWVPHFGDAKSKEIWRLKYEKKYGADDLSVVSFI